MRPTAPSRLPIKFHLGVYLYWDLWPDVNQITNLADEPHVVA
jgi:hypothetical protein